MVEYALATAITVAALAVVVVMLEQAIRQAQERALDSDSGAGAPWCNRGDLASGGPGGEGCV